MYLEMITWHPFATNYGLLTESVGFHDTRIIPPITFLFFIYAAYVVGVYMNFQWHLLMDE